MNKPAEKAPNRSAVNYPAWTVCDVCKEGVHLHEAGFEVELHRCNMCGNHVADRAEFFKFNEGVRALSK